MLDIREEKWNVQAAIFLEPACSSDYSINDLAYDVQAGHCSLFNVYDGTNHIGSMVLRLEDAGHVRELVVVALGGKNKSGNLIQQLNGFWDELALKNDAKTVRAHVSTDRMARLMARAGGKLCEYVFRREVA